MMAISSSMRLDVSFHGDTGQIYSKSTFAFELSIVNWMSVSACDRRELLSETVLLPWTKSLDTSIMN